jgi:hypothetical protein
MKFEHETLAQRVVFAPGEAAAAVREEVTRLDAHRVLAIGRTVFEGLPVELSVTSGLNALAHCVDSMWAPRADPISPRSWYAKSAPACAPSVPDANARAQERTRGIPGARPAPARTGDLRESHHPCE